MTDQNTDGPFWQPILRLVKLFVRYAFETFVAVGVFGVLLAASWITHCFNTSMSERVPEFTTVFKWLELFLLAMGAVLFVLFIVRNTVTLAKILLRDIFSRRNSEEGGGSE